jgi:hypothetical protein
MQKQLFILVAIAVAGCTTLDDRIEELGMTPCATCGTDIPVGQQLTASGFQPNPWFVNGVIAADLPSWHKQQTTTVKTGAAFATSGYMKEVAEATVALGGAWGRDVEIILNNVKISRATGFAPHSECNPNIPIYWIKESIAADGCEMTIKTGSAKLDLGVDLIKVDDLLQRAANKQAQSTGTSPAISQAKARCNTALDVQPVNLPDAIASAKAAEGQIAGAIAVGVGGGSQTKLEFKKSTTLGYRPVKLQCVRHSIKNTALGLREGIWLHEQGAAITLIDSRVMAGGVEQLLIRARSTGPWSFGKTPPTLENATATNAGNLIEIVKPTDQEWGNAPYCNDINRSNLASCKLELPGGVATVVGSSLAEGGGFGTVIIIDRNGAPTGKYFVHAIREQYTEAK